MRRIQSLSELADKERRRRRLGGIVIIALLVLSTLGFALSSVGTNNSGTTEQEGFSYNGQYWVYTAGTQKYYFTHHPDELNFSFDSTKNLAYFTNKQIYVDSQIIGGVEEVYSSLGVHGSIKEACYGPCVRDLPERTCDAGDPLIVLREAEQESITQEESCIFINGSLKTVDAFLYKVLGIG